MCTPVLNDFMKGWISLFSRSMKTKLSWQTQVPSFSVTRWRSKWEVMRHVHDFFGDIHVPSFLDNDELPPSNKKLQEILSDPAKHRKLKIELAKTIDAMKAFFEATYRLEGGGGPLIFFSLLLKRFAYSRLQQHQCIIPIQMQLTRTLANNSTQLQHYRLC